MKNREKFPKTEDAIKAHEEHKRKYNCDCTFDEWLNADEDAAKKTASKLAGLMAGALFAPLLIKDALNALEDDGEEADKRGEGHDVGDLGKCPVCGSDKVECHPSIIACIECPDCGLFFGATRSSGKEDHDKKLLANWRKLQENVKK